MTSASRAPFISPPAASERASSDRIVNELFASRGTASPAERTLIEDQIVRRHLSLAMALAHRYRDRGADRDDLEQVANLALVKAMRGFDEDKGAFVPFATATILGELKRHFRDQCWAVRPPRRVQELQADIIRASADHWQRHSEAPTAEQLAVGLDSDVASVREAQAASGCYSPTSLDVSTRSDSQTMGDLLVDDHASDFDHVDDVQVVAGAMSDLDEQQRQLIRMRFFDDLTQQQIADRIGVSQMQVSRRLSRLLKDLRSRLGVAVA